MTVERISVEQLQRWRADPGWTAITLEILPHDPITVSMPDRDLDEALREFEHMAKITEADRADVAYYAEIRRMMVEQLVPAVARFDKRTILPCAVAALWCVLNHPNDKGMLRLKMDALREHGKAPHFTLCRGVGAKATYGTVIGDRYADIRRDVQQRVGAGTTILTARD
jgi:hypothetical protein